MRSRSPCRAHEGTVRNFPDGRIEARQQGLTLPYRIFNRITWVDQDAIIENAVPCRWSWAPRPPVCVGPI